MEPHNVPVTNFYGTADVGVNQCPEATTLWQKLFVPTMNVVCFEGAPHMLNVEPHGWAPLILEHVSKAIQDAL